MDITKISLIELKALAFDVQQEVVRSQNNLNILGAEIDKRLKEQPIMKEEAEITE